VRARQAGAGRRWPVVARHHGRCQRDLAQRLTLMEGEDLDQTRTQARRAQLELQRERLLPGRDGKRPPAVPLEHEAAPCAYQDVDRGAGRERLDRDPVGLPLGGDQHEQPGGVVERDPLGQLGDERPAHRLLLVLLHPGERAAARPLLDQRPGVEEPDHPAVLMDDAPVRRVERVCVRVQQRRGLRLVEPQRLPDRKLGGSGLEPAQRVRGDVQMVGVGVVAMHDGVRRGVADDVVQGRRELLQQSPRSGCGPVRLEHDEPGLGELPQLHDDLPSLTSRSA
jgi:hypothetical protein